ncbi:hypothetical protein MRB53_028508 [Persea americana]|uniref:Uncharacterized protein n=1 Tax=Persea americana TaxID=3435 RepID=A0ACC2KG90_PERAE|nr:hypothetical protein MRB53_028508 [Persea americana]
MTAIRYQTLFGHRPALEIKDNSQGQVNEETGKHLFDLTHLSSAQNSWDHCHQNKIQTTISLLGFTCRKAGMAALLLSPLLKVVFDKLVSLITEEQRLQRGVHKEMERLRSTLTTIQAVLEDAEEQQVNDKAVKHWVGELKDAAYDADDILD